MKRQNKRFSVFISMLAICLLWIGIVQSPGVLPGTLHSPIGEIASMADHSLAAGVGVIAKPGISLFESIQPLSLFFQNRDGDRLVLGGNYTLDSGESLDGSLIVLGGNAQVKEGAAVSGDIVVLGGSLGMYGVTNGDILILAGAGELGPAAVVRGDVTIVSGNLRRDPSAQIEGKVSENVPVPIPLPQPGNPAAPAAPPAIVVNESFSIWNGLFFLFRSFIWAALAILIVLFFPKNTQRIADAVVSSTFVVGGMGILTALTAPIILVMVAITIIGIPISFFAALVLGAAWTYGMLVLGVETGNRLGRLVNQDWALPVSAGIGTFLMTIVVNGVREIVPCVGWLAPFLVGSIGLGATLLTLFGVRSYPIEADNRVDAGIQIPSDVMQPELSQNRSLSPDDQPEQAPPSDE